MKTRTLTIRREQLGELNAGELASVAGASGWLCDYVYIHVDTDLVTGICPTWDCTGCYLTCGC